MKYLKLFEEQTGQVDHKTSLANLKRLRSLGITKYAMSWKIMLEVDWDQAAQSEPNEVKDYFIEIFVPVADQYGYKIDVNSIEVDNWKHSNYWRGSVPKYDRRDFVICTLDSPTADQEEVEQWIDDHLLGRLFSSLESIEEIDIEVTEARTENQKRLVQLGVSEPAWWNVEYDTDMSAHEKTDYQQVLNYESPTGAHVTRVEGGIDAFQTQLTLELSDGDQIQLHIKFSQYPGDNGQAAFNIRHGGTVYEAPKWTLLFGHGGRFSAGKSEEWLDKVEELGSPVKPIFYYYEKFLAGLNSTTLTEMIKSDSTKLKLFIRALRDLPIDSSEILKIRELVNTRSIDPYNDRLSILAEVDRVFSDIPGLSNLVQKFSRPLS